MLYTLITTRYRNRKSSRSSEWAVNNEYSQYRFIHSRRYCNSGGSAGTLTALKRRENSCIKGLCRLLVYYNIVVYSSRYSLYWQTFISWCLIYFLTRNLAIANRSRILAAPKWPSTVTQGHLYDFLLPFHSNYGPILYRFPHIAKYLSKIAKFIYATCIQRPYKVKVKIKIKIKVKVMIKVKITWICIAPSLWLTPKALRNRSHSFTCKQHYTIPSSTS